MTVQEFETVPVEQVRRKPRKAAAGPKYVARKAMTLGERRIKPGDVVPEAASWPRVEAWVRSGYLDLVEG